MNISNVRITQILETPMGDEILEYEFDKVVIEVRVYVKRRACTIRKIEMKVAISKVGRLAGQWISLTEFRQMLDFITEQADTLIKQKS